MSNIFNLVFYQPILNLVVFIYNILPGHDLGIVIIILTVLIKLLLYPLSQKSIKSQKELQDLQPKINEIKIKYANNKEEQGRAMLNIYKEHKINPFSSCLPLLIQLPFLWAIFAVFRSPLQNGALDYVYSFIYRPEMIDSFGFFGLLDLSKRSIVLAVLAGLAQFWQAKMMMAKRPIIKAEALKDEDMSAIMSKQMTYMMPLLTIFIGITLPSGLALYWLVTTIFQIVQQMIIFNKKNNSLVTAEIKSENNKEVVEGEIIKK